MYHNACESLSASCPFGFGREFLVWTRLIRGRGPRLLWGGGLVTRLQPLIVHKQRAVVPCYYISTMYCSTFQSQYSDSLGDGDFVHTDPSRIH
jgi:hypothetical protein